MKIFRYILFIAAVLLMAGCRDRNIPDGGELQEGEPKGMVCLSAGTEQMAVTRAGSISYMPSNVRFSAMMIIHEGPGEYKYEHPFFANMIVDGAGAGNSWYYKSDYSTPTQKDSYDNDDDASAFYWQNRLMHGFVGYIDDYNKALPWAQGAAGATEYFPKTISDWDPTGPGIGNEGEKQVDKTHPEWPILYTLKKDGTILRWQQYEKFDLKRNNTDTAMCQQKDPLVAYTEKIPEYSTPERNRVYLTFRHQFAQVQVNLRGSKQSAEVTKEMIERVELLGVSEYAYVFPYPEYGCVNDTTFTLDSDGHKVDDGNGNPQIDHVETSWTIARQGKDRTELLRPALAEKVDLTQYTEAQLAENEFGTSFQLFDMAESNVTTGYIKGYEGIAYGNLGALRIVWHEDPDSQENDVVHDIVFKIADDKFKVLESGKRYIFNLELRRGTLAIIKAVIDDWIPYETEYTTTGTVVK